MKQDEEVTKIRTLVDNWAMAARAKDMDGVLAHHTDDIMMFDAPMPLRCQGMEEYKRTWELFFANTPGGLGAFDVTELQVVAGDKVAYCHAILKIFDTEARLTIGLRKENSEWIVAHEHHSYPIELN